jgi:hypothetical protein
MMENIYNLKIKKRIHFWKKRIIHFVNVETEPRLWYKLGEPGFLGLAQVLHSFSYESFLGACPSFRSMSIY